MFKRTRINSGVVLALGGALMAPAASLAQGDAQRVEITGTSRRGTSFANRVCIPTGALTDTLDQTGAVARLRSFDPDRRLHVVAMAGVVGTVETSGRVRVEHVDSERIGRPLVTLSQLEGLALDLGGCHVTLGVEHRNGLVEVTDAVQPDGVGHLLVGAQVLDVLSDPAVEPERLFDDLVAAFVVQCQREPRHQERRLPHAAAQLVERHLGVLEEDLTVGPVANSGAGLLLGRLANDPLP